MTRRWAALALFALACLHSAVAADFNGDGKQDIVWRLPSGNPQIWLMDGLSISAQQTLAIAPDAGSSIVGTGRFFPHGSGAIAWVDSQHRLHVWQITGGVASPACAVATGINPNWSFLGIGDINGDGIDDVLWRDTSTGAVNAFLMDGCSAPTTVSLGTAAASLSFAGAGDSDGHGRADMFWRNASGDVVIWRNVNSLPVSVQTLAAGSYAGWQIAAVADFDGDGKADLLWRDPNGSDLALWLMNGATFTAVPVTAAAANVFVPVDDIFANGFDTGGRTAPALSTAWTILGAADFDGDGKADILLADQLGNTAIWQMHGAGVAATAMFPPMPDMPLAGLTGWRLPMDRVTVTKINDQVTVGWSALAGSPSYTLYASSANDPANTGTASAVSGSALSFARNAPAYADKRYFAVSAAYNGIQLPPSKEAYLVEFAMNDRPYWGAMAIADINRDGCEEILGSAGDCHGNFTILSEADMGLGALRAPGRVYRDLRFADLDGDGIDDLIANTYSSINDTNSQVLFFRGVGNATFVEDADFTNMMIRGDGETIVIADFNNDGYLDVFLPHYSFHTPAEHSWLLLNDGHGHFTDVAESAGVAMRNVSIFYRTEGAQALDINGDGWIDLYAGSQLFINNGVSGSPTFTNVGNTFDLNGVSAASPWALPAQFDEGSKFIDLDNSGRLALVLNTVYGIRVFAYDGAQHFSERDVIPPIYMNTSYGLTTADVDGDGLTDIVVAGGVDQSINTNSAYTTLRQEFEDARISGDPEITEDLVTGTTSPNALPQLLVNRGGRFVIHDFYDDGLTPDQRDWNDLQTYADFDYNGTIDLVSRYASQSVAEAGHLTVLMNRAASSDTLHVTLLGANGERNQAGRVVHVAPDAKPGLVMTQIVDGGSGYMGNSPYELTFAAPYAGAYTVSARFADATYTAVAHTGDHVLMYADGTVVHQ